MTGPPEMYSIAGVALVLITVLSLFVRSTVRNQRSIVDATLKRQDEMFVWFTHKLNGSLDALKTSIESQQHATEHNTKNLKTVQTLSTDILKSMRETYLEQDKANTDLIMSKLEEILERDRSRTRETESGSPHT